MKQCRRCRLSFRCRGEIWCRVRSVQVCHHNGGVQKLTMAPGLCQILNPQNNCSLFKPIRLA